MGTDAIEQSRIILRIKEFSNHISFILLCFEYNIEIHFNDISQLIRVF